MNLMFAERTVAYAVLLVGILVGIITINHGDLPLGILFLLGQIQGMFGKHGHHDTTHDATHLAIHHKA